MKPTTRSNPGFGTATVLFVLAAACGDGSGSRPQTETETHFLKLCDSTCGEGLECICGACTELCTTDRACAKFGGGASCTATPDACSGDVAKACEMACTTRSDCQELGPPYRCEAGRCRASDDGGASGGNASGSSASGSGGQSGAGDGGPNNAGNGGTGGSGDGGQSSAGAGATGGGAGGSSGNGSDAGVDAGGDGGTGTRSCNTVGAACCDPFPQDGPNYCTGGRLACGADDKCEVNCMCVLGSFIPVCGTDGQTYDTSCGTECVPVPIACDGMCPCACTQDLGCAASEPGGGVPCCGGLTCCMGVPYDPKGECRTDCPFLSDRNAKTDIRPADTQALLDAVTRLPISAWRYRTAPEASHVGPMAQDFATELGLGSDDRMINAVDANGVALAAIQALNARVESLARHSEALQQRIDELEAAVGSRR